MLNKMDTYLLENIDRLGNTGTVDENPRGRYESDGAEAHSCSIRGGVHEVFDLQKGEFPITDTRRVPIKMSMEEMLVIYQDQSNKIADFEKRGVKWWAPWDIGDGSIGLRYGETIREYDQMNNLLEGLVNDPYSKRHLMDMYQFEHLQKSKGLPPCFFLTMWSVAKVNGENYLDLTLIGRSSDLLVAGTGVNQMQYVALQLAVAKHCGYKVGLFEIYRKNVHVYDRHMSQLEETVKRLDILKETEHKSNPKLVLNVPDFTDFYQITVDDFQLLDYNPIKEPLEKFDLAV
jgi:thymidylate synthase